MSFYLAIGTTRLIECYMSAGRIQEFLETVDSTLAQRNGISRKHLTFSGHTTQSESEHVSQRDSILQEEEDCMLNQSEDLSCNSFRENDERSPRVVPLVAMSNVSSDIKNANESPILSHINLHAEEAKLIVITGPVGCGKTSLLLTILGELSTKHGQLTRQGNVAFVSQTPWVFSGTLRDNILFNNTYEPQRYSKVIEVCALERDIDLFPDGDLTMLGERGVVLSGGQRARIGLARAVYANADLYLLDDPLSAVDAEVAHHIFEQCICEMLADRVRILATHQVHYLKYAEHILLMQKACIEWDGSYAEMLQRREVPLEDGPSEKTKKKDGNEQRKQGGRRKSEHPGSREEKESLSLAEEDRHIGSVSYKTYWRYINEGMFVTLIIPLFLLLAFAEGKN